MKCCGKTSDSNSKYLNHHVNHQLLMQIPGCTVHLMDGGEAIEIAGPANLSILCVTDENVSLAITVKVGEDLQWPLTKDEPVVKLDELHYLFTIPVKGGEPLSYGVGFSEQSKAMLASFDAFLQEKCCFSRSSSDRRNMIDWKEFAPKIEAYNGVLARAIAGGTGHVIKGIFKCSNAYTSQVHKGGEMILAKPKEGEKAKKKSDLNKNLKRVRRLSKMTERISKAMLDGLGVASGSVMGPLVRSKTGQAFFSMVSGEVLLASLDAIDTILNAAEAAEKQALQASSGAAVRAVSERYGEKAGEATGHVLATAGHCAGTAWNVFKIRKAINPASSVSSGVIKTTHNLRKSRSSSK